ncbi:MAG: type II toxin-antitoxin system PemK/MazF family toxin [Pseudomonadota bacterium]
MKPVTNQIKGYPFEVIITPCLKVTGAALSDQVKSLDWKIRNTEFYDKIPDTVMSEILNKLGVPLRFDR